MALIRALSGNGGGGGNVASGSVPWSELNGKTTYTINGLGFTPKRIVVSSATGATYYALCFYDADRDATKDFGAYYSSSFMANGQAQSTASMYGAVYDVTNGSFKIKNIDDNTVFTNGLNWIAVG